MKYKTFKKFDTKDYKEIYTKEKETKAIEIEVDGITIFITKQEMGLSLGKPHIEISVGNETYCMDLSTFIESIKKF